MSEERQVLLTQIKQDEDLISIIKDRLASRQEAYTAAALAVQTATKALQEAELRRTGAERYYNGALNSLKQLKSSYPEEERSSSPRPTESSPHLAALSKLWKKYTQLIKGVEELLTYAREELRAASEAVAISAEKLEGFRTLCRFSEGDMQLLEKYMKELENRIAQNASY
jgi:chromosome segregation ATPase